MNAKTGGQASTEAKARKVVLVNRRARHEYHIVETYDAGLALVGTEVKSIRQGGVNVQEAYCKVERGEVWLHNMHIAPYDKGSRWNGDPRRPRKLLLHRREIDKLTGQTERKGYALVPLSVYFENGYAKLEIGLGIGKKLHDKREAIADRDARRDAEREFAAR